MVGQLQPLDQWQRIVKDDGTPTPEFIRWAQTRQIDITNGIDAAAAQQLIDDWAAARDIIAGAGLTGGGSLAVDRTLDVGAGTGISVAANAVNLADTAVTPGTYGDATNVPQITIDQQGRITAATDVAISGGGGGSDTEFNITTIPTVADFTTGWINQGTATTSDTGDGILWTNDNDGEYHMLVKAAPTAPYDLYLRVQDYPRAALAATTITSQPAIILRDGGDGEFLAIQALSVRTGSAPRYAVQLQRWNSPTSYNTDVLTAITADSVNWVRVNVTSTTVTVYGAVGKSWVSFGTETIATFVDNITQVGIGVRSDSTNTANYTKFQNFGTTAPS